MGSWVIPFSVISHSSVLKLVLVLAANILFTLYTLVNFQPFLACNMNSYNLWLNFNFWDFVPIDKLEAFHHSYSFLTQVKCLGGFLLQLYSQLRSCYTSRPHWKGHKNSNVFLSCAMWRVSKRKLFGRKKSLMLNPPSNCDTYWVFTNYTKCLFLSYKVMIESFWCLVARVCNFSLHASNKCYMGRNNTTVKL